MLWIYYKNSPSLIKQARPCSSTRLMKKKLDVSSLIQLVALCSSALKHIHVGYIWRSKNLKLKPRNCQKTDIFLLCGRMLSGITLSIIQPERPCSSISISVNE